MSIPFKPSVHPVDNSIAPSLQDEGMPVSECHGMPEVQRGRDGRSGKYSEGVLPLDR